MVSVYVVYDSHACGSAHGSYHLLFCHFTTAPVRIILFLLLLFYVFTVVVFMLVDVLAILLY